MTQNTWRADPLVWGHGPRVFEVFLEPTCPFSVRAFGKLDDLLDEAGEDQVTVRIRLQSQPWHMYSGVIVRCILAASTLREGKQAAKSVLAAVAAHREEFEFERHCRGANMDATPGSGHVPPPADLRRACRSAILASGSNKLKGGDPVSHCLIVAPFAVAWISDARVAV
jgi:hypothetical protein